MIEPGDPFDLYGDAVLEDELARRDAYIHRRQAKLEAKAARSWRIDVLRGAALAWMLVSHWSLVSGWFWFPRGWGWPVFVAISGACWRPRLGRRWLTILGWGVLLAPITAHLGLNSFNVLLAWGLVLPIMWWARSAPVLWWTVAGVATLWAWPYGGANPGLLILCWLIGRQAGTAGIEGAGAWLPRVWLLELAGQHPLTVYVGHLLVLLVIWW